MRVTTLLILSLLALGSVVVFAEETKADDKKEDAAAAELIPEGFTAEQWQATKTGSETHQFQAEVSRLMEIIIHSLYGNREVFLRELLSNASDALDKLRFLALTNKALVAGNDKLEVHIDYNKAAKTITVTDTGIGMTKQELLKNLGVVASSGTTKFLEAAAKGAEPVKLIGQFGVGFYSVYLVADRVTVVSKHHDDEQHVWTSDANQVFTVNKDPRGNTLGRGTQIILHLKEDASEFLDQSTLERIIKRYSEFIQFPIYLKTTRTETKEVPVEEESKDEEKKDEADAEKKDDDDVKVSDEEDADKKDEAKKPKTKTVSEEVVDWKLCNENKALWTRDPSNVTKEEYEAFYKALTKDDQGPLTWIHFAAEGEVQFKAILYVPKKAAHDLYDKYYQKSNAMKLYVRRVLISDEFEDFLPRYLNFVKGVVDSDDLPLTVSRETLSKNKVLKVIAKKLTRKALDMLKKIEAGKVNEGSSADDDKKDDSEDKKDDSEEKKDEADDKDKQAKKDEEYSEFFGQFGKSIKLGMIEDSSSRSKLAKLVRFYSTHSDKLTSLQQYVDRMKKGQKDIYYLTAETLEAARRSPFLERLKKRGYECLLMADPLDEYVMSNVHDFDGHKFVSVAKEGLKFGDENEKKLKERQKVQEEEFKPLTEWLKTVYGDKVEKVMVSNRITSSPCVLVTSQWGWSANMERIMRAQTFGDVDKQAYMVSKKTMEINPRHPIIKQLKEKAVSSPDDASVKDIANLLYDGALLSSGFTVQDVADFTSRINRVVSSGLSVDPNAVPEDEPEPEADSEEGSDGEDEDKDSSEPEVPASTNGWKQMSEDEIAADDAKRAAAGGDAASKEEL